MRVCNAIDPDSGLDVSESHLEEPGVALELKCQGARSELYGFFMDLIGQDKGKSSNVLFLSEFRWSEEDQT